jgi:hypothetical protein
MIGIQTAWEMSVTTVEKIATLTSRMLTQTASVMFVTSHPAAAGAVCLVVNRSVYPFLGHLLTTP